MSCALLAYMLLAYLTKVLEEEASVMAMSSGLKSLNEVLGLASEEGF